MIWLYNFLEKRKNGYEEKRYYEYFIFILVVIGFILLGYIQRNKNTKENEDPEIIEQRDEEYEDYNEVFIKNKGDKEIVPLVKTFFPNDKIIIRSLLQSAEIENYVKNDSLSRLYPGIKGFSKQDAIIYIYNDNKEEARKIIEDYIETIKDERKEKKDSTGRNITEFVAVGVTVPSGKNRELPELLIE